jgi:hypothetical protein
VLPVTPRGRRVAFLGPSDVAEPFDYSSVSHLDQPCGARQRRSQRRTAPSANPIQDLCLPSLRNLSNWRLHRRLTAAFIALGSIACGDTLRGIAPSPAVSESHADQLFEALATRFNQVELAPKYDTARVRLAESALVPSRVFDDSSVWVALPSPSIRLLYISGGLAGGHYRLEPRPLLGPAARPGDTRHTIALEQLAPSVYRWDTRVDLAVGAITGEEMSVFLSKLFGAAEGRSERELRDDYRAAFPRAAAVFGRGFTIDSLRVTPGAIGSTSVAITASFHRELMRPTYPALAAYLDKYLGPAKYHFALSDRTGIALFDVVGQNRSMTVRYRVQQGQLVSLFGPPRPWSDSLVLVSDVSLKVRHFTVGFHKLVTDFVMSNSGHDRSWTVVAQREPMWDLPLITERLLRAPLRRPFEVAGSMLRLSVRDSAGAQSLFIRRTRLDVQESAIMRFVGSLIGHAVGELDARVELEEDRFLHDGFAALQADVRTLGRRWGDDREER